MDVIFIQEFRARTLIGIYDWERIVHQNIELNIELAIPDARACRSDKIGDTIDYGIVVARIVEILDKKHFSLLEALAEHIAEVIIVEFGSPWVRLSVAKIDALTNVKKLGVKIERSAPR